MDRHFCAWKESRLRKGGDETEPSAGLTDMRDLSVYFIEGIRSINNFISSNFERNTHK